MKRIDDNLSVIEKTGFMKADVNIFANPSVEIEPGVIEQFKDCASIPGVENPVV